MRFSQRIGKTIAQKLVQRETIDNDLRISLWNAVTVVYFDRVTFMRRLPNYTKNSSLKRMMWDLWQHLFKQPVDRIPLSFSDCKNQLRKWFFQAEWYEVFDFIEACVEYGPPDFQRDFVVECNFYLNRESSAYRFVNNRISEITSEEEIEEVERAISDSTIFFGAREHLSCALRLMNDRAEPDFRNSIKESISAVESVVISIVGNDKATLGKALNEMERNWNLHKALKNAFSVLYGYTSDEGGIRHALLEESTITKADARFMLVACSSFVNYLIELHEK